MAGKKFSELELLGLTDFSQADILASTDVSDFKSKRLTFGDLKTFVASDLTGDGLLTAEQIINTINAFTPTPEQSGVDADLLDGLNGEDYLDYDNFINTPTIPVELSDLDNISGFIRLNLTTNRLEYRPRLNGVEQGVIAFDTDNLIEGQTNLYYTTQRFISDLDANLEARLNQTLTVFFDGSLNDNVVKCQARVVELSEDQSNQLDGVEFVDNFNEGQVVRLYGANIDNSVLPDVSKRITNILVTPNFFSNSGPTTHTIRYKIAEMNLTNGNISSSSQEYSVTIASKSLGGGLYDSRPILDQFDDNFNISIRMTTSGTVLDRAVLVYRAVDSLGSTGDYKLYYVGGPKELSRGIVVDYGTYDYVSYSGKNESDNTFSEMIHVPLTPPNATLRGWADVTLTQVDYSQGRMAFTPSVYADSNQLVNVSHNDTAIIQYYIDFFKSTGRSALQFNDKVYVSGTLDIPENFAIKGRPGVSKIVKLPWSSHAVEDLSNNMFRFKDGVTKNVSVQDLMLDGLSQYQVRLSDDTVASDHINYAIHYSDNSDNCSIINVKADNLIGGGIYAELSTDLRINLTEMSDLGTTDRFDYSPAKLTEARNILLTNCRFTNFTDSLDLSVSSRGIVAPNVVSNCGSGMVVYGSSFLVTQPNMILGPSNEIIRTPDAFNSVFDSINIRLEEGQVYESDVYRYQENGFDYNLTAENGKLEFLVFALEKNSQGDENLYLEINGPQGTDATQYLTPVYDVSINGEVGLFKFKISAENVTKLQNDYEFDTMSLANPDHVGIVYTANLKTESFAGFIGNVADVSTVNAYTYEVSITDYENLAVGDEVVLVGHTDFFLGDDDLSTAGKIIQIEPPVNGSVLITIEYDSAAVITPGQANRGELYLFKNKTIAKGRVL